MKSHIFLFATLVAGKVFAAATMQVQCSFLQSNVKLQFPQFQMGCAKAGDCPLEVEMEGKEAVKASVTGFSRGSAVIGDSKDRRPAALITLASGDQQHRLAIYYCSGNGQTVEAKLFNGKTGTTSADFISQDVSLGTCIGRDLTKFLTNDCSSYK